jgi:hypothetical protein
MITRSTALLAVTFALVLSVAARSRAAAQTEIEVDPVAYALNGYSFHVARILGATRLNVGTFGIDVPRMLHGNDGWSSRMRGVGVKWDYLGSDPDGFFAGLEVGYMRMRYTLDAVAATETRGVIGTGVRAGYRVPLGRSGLYVVPWAAVSYNIDGDDVVVGGEAFDRSRVSVYPLLHFGWRF